MGGHSGRLEAKIVSRGKGHSAVSKAAYNARASLDNERLGTRDDYSRKHADCLFSGIYAPAKSPEWTRDREQLWNHVEAFEKRKDGQLARELLIDLPHELTPEQSRWVLQDFIKENFTRKGLVADLAIHAPHRHSDERNIHAHLLVVLRKLDGTEFAATKTRQTYAENVAELDGWKRSLEQHMNKALKRHGHEQRWDLRSNEARGLDREPEIHLGKAAAALERQGIETAPGNVNRQIQERNRDRAAANENENDRAEWVREQIAEAEAATLPELQIVQRERDQAAAEAQAEQEAELQPQHREARPLFDHDQFLTLLDEMRMQEARSRGDGSDWQGRRAMENLARIDPLGTERNFGHHIGDHLKTPEEISRESDKLMRGGRTAADLAAEWDKAMADAQREQDLTRDSARERPAPKPEHHEPAPAPVPVVTQDRDQANDLAAYAERQRQAFEDAQRTRAALETESERRRLAANALALKPEAEAVRKPDPVPAPIHQPQAPQPAKAPEMDFEVVLREFEANMQRLPPAPAPEAVRPPPTITPLPVAAPVRQPEALPPAKAPEQDIETILREFDENWRKLAPPPAPQPAREPEPVRERERTLQPERPAPAPEIARPSLFQTLTHAVLGWWNVPEPTPQPDRAADRYDAGDDRQAEHVKMPARAPARKPTSEPAPEPAGPRPAERLGLSVSERMLEEARAEIEAERARETPQQRADRERRETEQSRGRGDGTRERTRNRHGLLWELFHPFQHRHDMRRRRREP